MQKIIKGILYMTLSLPLLISDSIGKIITVQTLQQVQEALSPLEEGTVIFLDVDDTLITPLFKTFPHLKSE